MVILMNLILLITKFIIKLIIKFIKLNTLIIKFKSNNLAKNTYN